jgi:hypothetical protein
MARWLLLFTLFIVFAATVPSFVGGRYWALLLTPCSFWVWTANMFHDASHFALSQHWMVNAAAGYLMFPISPLEWAHQHVVGHHAYPNMPHRDPDLCQHRIFGDAYKGLDLEIFLDAFEEQIDLPAGFVDIGDLPRRQAEVVRQKHILLTIIRIPVANTPQRNRTGWNGRRAARG